HRFANSHGDHHSSLDVSGNVLKRERLARLHCDGPSSILATSSSFESGLDLSHNRTFRRCEYCPRFSGGSSRCKLFHCASRYSFFSIDTRNLPSGEARRCSASQRGGNDAWTV